LPQTPHDRLDSWKEIAAYLQRGVRTVRRWEKEEGLPVHRQVHQVLGSVYGYKSEIEAWRQRRARRPSAGHVPPSATAADVKSIVVLPFTNLSTDPENGYFADGLTDEVTAGLSHVRSLRVTSRTSSMTFKETTKDVRAIAAALGVRYVVEGSVRRAENRLRVTAQLIDAGADEHLWSDKYDGTLDDVFAIQERIARTIVDALELRLSADEDRRLAHRPIGDVRAYDCYLRARQEGWRWREDAIGHAIQLLHEALAIAGENADLYAALGRAYLQYREAGIDFGERPLEEAEHCARKVFALEPQSAAGLQLRGWIRYSRGDIQDAVLDLKRALAIEPNNADTLLLLTNCCLISGRMAAARPLIERLLAVDPLTPVSRCMPAWADVLEGRVESAVAPYRLMFEMDPGNPMARLFYVWILVINRRHEAAGAIADACPAEARGTVAVRIASFLVDAAAGKPADALTLTPDIEAVATATDVFPRFLAQGFAIAGMADLALDWLTVAVDRGFINYPYLAANDPALESIRSHPRFAQLMDRVRVSWERFRDS
jgi:TolB-like protein